MTWFFILHFSLVSFGQETGPRPKFSKEQIKVGHKSITVEVADDERSRSYGLMFVKKLDPDQGMLFVFEHADFQAFWMKNTLIPLSIGYFDAKGVLFETLEMVPEPLVAKNFKSYPSKKPALYALEMNKGWFQKNKIKIGARLERKSRSRSKSTDIKPVQ